MSWYQGNDLKKPTGGKKSRHRNKRKYELGRAPTMTKLSTQEARKNYDAFLNRMKDLLSLS